ncbi:E3 ubiquitin-protein ligase rnf8 isoform X2 [Lampris incognitus]|uniref:E3 ubiquitin-protein ligase rnf8 isoform X2 n=1 Tax=Lampris incognitus TaxID=2546036 RepID=UPI0024B4CA66|nr:E3 ubiquitin-protein ligase rnf8 isoform X2 [Lampris incognitus]
MEVAAANEDECEGTDAWCLSRVGRDSEWLHLDANTEVTVGRGNDVIYQLLSPSCPLMISRLHCVFKRSEGGQWTVTDRQSLNGVWVNENRIPVEEAHPIRLGDSIKLGVPPTGDQVEFEYILIQRPLKDIKPYLAKRRREDAHAVLLSKKLKRKPNTDEVEPSTSSKPKHYCCSTPNQSAFEPCPGVEHQEEPSPVQAENPAPSVHVQVDLSLGGSSVCNDLDNLQMYSQNILILQEQFDNTQKQVTLLEEEQQEGDPLRKEQVLKLQSQLANLKAKMQKMESLKRSFSKTKKHLEAQTLQQQEELLKKQLEDAFQEQNKVIEELALSQQDFEKILLAKNKELEVTKEEKEKERAQKEEVVTQVTEVLENELQCIICSELLIKAVILNCAHSFCQYCIREWCKRKDECPICRQIIWSQTRCLALDNCIDSMVQNLSLDMKAQRQALIAERKVHQGLNQRK